MDALIDDVLQRRRLVMLGAASLAAIAGTLYLQYFKAQDPCPLCVLQRYGYLLIAIFAFTGAAVGSRRSIVTAELLMLLTALGGFAAAARQVWLHSHPSFNCRSDKLQPIIDALPLAKLLPGVFKVSGLCETPYPPILGVSLPQWSLLGFILILALVARSLWRSYKV